ncbi:inverse autotransporter beta domain-containing protein [Hydrogenophaga sp. 2FB]|uniref:inverse autotransporter beta domain-containing protein n=1 Tax=Hydrogenophaga sp. 2FB TaxID=2502187 RepID=UPI0010F56D36|nr:inverse autotransporter beta domain-containing protein [Hydrogenophaga sp. 2FB]
MTPSHKRTSTPSTLLVILLGSLAHTAHAQGQPASDTGAATPKWGAHIDLEAKPGNKRSLGEMDLFVPLAQGPNTLFFGNLRGRIAEGNSHEGNVGLGVRRMLDSGWNLGAFVHLDRRRTPSGSRFKQTTLGLEALGRDWDLRANVYNPQGNRVRDLASGPATATLSGTTVQVTSSMLQERALPGHDLEAGWRVPVFGADDHRQWRLYLGSYRFSDSLAKVSGVRVRAEYAVAELPQLWRGAQMTLGAELQHDAARGSQHFVSLRLRIPLGARPEGRRLNAQERRMTTPVVRDVDIVTQVKTSASTVETATQLANGQNLTVISSDSTTGVALPGAVAAAGANSTVLLTGSFNTSAITQLQPGQTLMGTGSLVVRTPSGVTASLTAPGATITGAVAGNNGAVHMGNNSTLTGMTVSNVSTGGGVPNPFAVFVNGVSNATIRNNALSVTENHVGGSAQAILITNGSSSITVTGNQLTATGTGIALGINVVNSSATVSGNTMSATGGGGGANSRAVGLNNANILPGSNGNTILNGICSVAGAGSGGQVGFTNAASCGP